MYWLITFLHIIPPQFLFKDYHNPILVAWNWSFLPLDMLVSITGFVSLYLWVKKSALWSHLALISLVLTFCAGLQAVVFWSIRLDFDWTWWLPNLYLLIYPLFFLKPVIKQCKSDSNIG